MNKFILALLLSVFSFSQAFAFNQAGSIDNLPEEYEEIDYSVGNNVPDHFEPINRAIFEFNNVVDGILLRPVAQIYRGVVPEWGRQRVTNILYNLGEPVTVVNSALQGDDINAFTALWRFIINSTFGVAGIFDAASEIGLEGREEDFGQTLYVWGWENSTYVVLPILGPSTVRDSIGLGVDYFVDPFNHDDVLDDEERIAHAVAQVISARTNILPVTDEIDRTSLDTYAAYQSLYLQKRRSDAINSLTSIY